MGAFKIGLDAFKAVTKQRYKANPIRAGLTDVLSTGALVGGASLLMRDSEDPPLVEITRLGDELKDWKKRPWDPENDPAYIDRVMNELHSSITDDLDTFLVPRSVAREKATDYVYSFLQMAQRKDGAPEMLSVRDQKVIYGAVGAEPPNPYTKDLPQGDTIMPKHFDPTHDYLGRERNPKGAWEG